MKFKKIISAVFVTLCLGLYAAMAIGFGSSSSENYDNSYGNYDKNDKYYSNNDHDNDGYINDDEFRDAVGDWMDDHGY